MSSHSDIPSRLATEVVQGTDGTFMILSGDLLGNHIKRGDPWEPHFTRIARHVVTPGARVIDVGANFGLNTVVLANAVGPGGVVVAIEPLRVIFQQLCGNCFLNGLPNVIAINAAVGATPGVVEMNPVNYYAQGWNFGDNQVGTGGEQVQAVSLDSLGLSEISFIKIDAQGSELDVLRGAQGTIRSGKPIMFIEIEEPQLLNRGASAQEAIDCVKSLGYLLIHIQNDYPVDYLCVPRERRDELPKLIELAGAPTSVIE